jgi:hypothetical protein
MKRRAIKEPATSTFDIVRTIGLALPDVEAATKYDGSPMLKVDGIFMAGLAMHPSAEPDTLVVRAGLEDREWLIKDAPETYYLTDYYRSYPLVLVRLSRFALCVMAHDDGEGTKAKPARGVQARSSFNQIAIRFSEFRVSGGQTGANVHLGVISCYRQWRDLQHSLQGSFAGCAAEDQWAMACVLASMTALLRAVTKACAAAVSLNVRPNASTWSFTCP